MPRLDQSRFTDALAVDGVNENVGENSEEEDSDDDDDQDDLDDEAIDPGMFMNMQGQGDLLMSNDAPQRHASSGHIEPYFTSPTSSLGLPSDDGLNSTVYSSAYPFDFGVGGHGDSFQVSGLGGVVPPSHRPFQYPVLQNSGLQTQRPASASASVGQDMVDVGCPRILHRVRIDAECTSEHLGNILQSIVGVAKSVTVKVESDGR